MKRISGIILSIAVTLNSAGFVYGGGNDITVKVNGNEIYTNVPPQIIEGRTMLPVRDIFEAVGAEVNWESETKTIISTKGLKSVSMSIGSDVMYIDGSETTMDAKPLIIDGRTLAPARYVAEAFGYDVEWDGESKTVIITEPVSSTENTYNNIMYEATMAEETEENTTVDSMETNEEVTEETTEKVTERETEETTKGSSAVNNSTDEIRRDFKKEIIDFVKKAYKLYVSMGSTDETSLFERETINSVAENWSAVASNSSEKEYARKAKEFYKKLAETARAIDEAEDTDEEYDERLEEIVANFGRAVNTADIEAVCDELDELCEDTGSSGGSSSSSLTSSDEENDTDNEGSGSDKYSYSEAKSLARYISNLAGYISSANENCSRASKEGAYWSVVKVDVKSAIELADKICENMDGKYEFEITSGEFATVNELMEYIRNELKKIENRDYDDLMECWDVLSDVQIKMITMQNFANELVSAFS